MKTIDIHTHLLNPDVSFNRLFDKITIGFFAKGLGVDPKKLRANPFPAYVEAMSNAVRQSEYIDKTCLFGVDARLDEKGREIHRDQTVCSDSSVVLKVAREHSDCFIPFCSVNPRRENAIELLEQYAEEGCKGAKFLQNYWCIDLNEARFLPYYETLKRLNLPLIVHLGSEFSVDACRESEGVDMLRLPLEAGVTVIGAHMALGQIQHVPWLWRNFSKRPETFDTDYYTLLEMLETHDNLYADFAAILAPLRARALRHLSEQKHIHHKLLFGTDYPVPFPIRFNSYDLSRSDRKKLSAIDNPFDRYCKAILHYFPEDSPLYSNYAKVLS